MFVAARSNVGQSGTKNSYKLASGGNRIGRSARQIFAAEDRTREKENESERKRDKCGEINFRYRALVVHDVCAHAVETDGHQLPAELM
jgi:hypothetical protein